MRMFTPTKILLLLTLLAANLGPAKTALAQSCPDPNCCKTCGAIWAGAETTRSCTGGTCWITSCSFHSNFCSGGFTDNFNDFCQSSAMFYCFPD